MSSERIRPGLPAAGVVGVRIVQPEGGRSAVDVVLERLRDEARGEGLAAGLALAHERAAQALSAAAERLDAWRDEASAELASTAVDLAVEIARHLVRAEVDAGRHDVERIVRETLRAAAVGRGECIVHLHPDDAAAIAGVAFRAGTRIVPDVGVGRGEVQVAGPSGLLVRDLEDALSDIRRRIQDGLREDA